MFMNIYSKESEGILSNVFIKIKNQMKTINPGSFIRNVFRGLLAIGLLFSFSACAKKVSFLTSSVVPAAQGYVKVDRDDNNNYTIHIEIINLAEVERLQPPNQAYVVWMVKGQESPQNIGQLNSSSSVVSKTLKASFKTISSSKPNKIFITAEDDPGIQYPGRQVVLSTDAF